MSNFNRITLVGNLTKDPECVEPESGQTYCKMRMAVNNPRSKNKETLYVGVKVFGAQAPSCGKHLTKGSSVLVDGRLVSQEAEIEGKEVKWMEVIANDVRFLGSKESATRSSSEFATEEKETEEVSF
jgi:single-strand DNA-binding protein